MNWNRTLVLTITCLLCVAGYAGARTRATAGSASDARLIVRRLPTMGKFVIVQIYVDNVMVGSMGYGGSYDGSLKPGHHVLSVLATPRSRSQYRPPTNIDVQSGGTYTFTATGDGRGNLTLSPSQ